MSFATKIKSGAARFLRDKRGNMGMFFGFGIIPVLGMVGASVDYITATKLKTQLQAAADSAALHLAHEARTSTADQLQTMGQAYMNGAFPLSNQASTPVTAIVADTNAKQVTVTTSSVVKGFFSKMLGQTNSTIHATATASYVLNKIEVALVLDNTGSMSEYGKMTALKTAVNNFITGLENSAISVGDAKLSVTPFNSEVQLNSTFANINGSFANSNMIKYGTGVFDMNSWYYLWSPKVSTDKAHWTGCLADRDMVNPYGYTTDPTAYQWDATSAAPVPSNPASLYVAAPCQFYGLATMQPLTTDLESIRTITNSMQPNGNTNIPIGYVMGLSTLDPTTPFGTNATTLVAGDTSTNKVSKFLVVLTDGENTMDRYYGDQASIDARLNMVCTYAKSLKDPRDPTGKTPWVTIFTIGLEMGYGAANPAVLTPCATDSGKYYGVQDSSQIDGVFKQILNNISAIRLKS